MKKSYIFIGLFLIFIIIITIVGSHIVSGNVEIKIGSDILSIQCNKEVYFNVYGYSLDNPNVIVNPYGNSPLTALVMFETDNYSEVEITIKGKENINDVYYKFDKNKYHMVPIYGLYADYNNTVIIKSEGVEKIINIKTDKLPIDFEFIDTAHTDNFVFLNGNYPYAIDSNGEVRWYLNRQYYGNISLLSNSSIIIGSDRYNEYGNTVSFYRMSLLGKIYNEYLLGDGYYGYNVVYDNSVVVLSDDILVIDMQTGDIIKKINNDGYDYLNISDDRIITHKDGIYYSFNDDKFEVVNYIPSISSGNFYNDTTNYNVSGSKRLGVLYETPVSSENIMLINYKKSDLSSDILIEREFDRIVVTNKREEKIYLILDKFMDKKVYEVDDVFYINNVELKGKYTVFYKINDTLYKTEYYIEV